MIPKMSARAGFPTNTHLISPDRARSVASLPSASPSYLPTHLPTEGGGADLVLLNVPFTNGVAAEQFAASIEARLDVNYIYNGTKYVEDFEGRVHTIPVHTAAITGNRFAQNLLRHSNDMTQSEYNVTNNAVIDSASQVTFDGTFTGVVDQYATIDDQGSGRTFVFSCLVSTDDTPSADEALYLRIAGDAITSANQFIGFSVSSAPQRFSVTASTDAAGTSVLPRLICNDAITVTATDWTLEDVTGQSNQNPSGPLPVDTATGVELVTDMSASQWVVAGSNTVEDVVENEVLLTYVDSGTAFRIDFDGDGMTAGPQTIGKKYIITGQAKVGSGDNILITTSADAPDAGADITSTTFVDFTLIAVCSSTTAFSMRVSVAAGETINIRNVSLREATNGFKQFTDTNGNTTSDGLVIETPGLPLFPTRSTRVGKSRAHIIKNRFYAPWESGEVVVAGDTRLPTDWKTNFGRQFYLVCTVGGTCDSSEPTWPTSINGTVTDNTVTWKAVGYYTNRGFDYEPAATNICLQSNDLSTTWSLNAAATTQNYAVSATGKKDANRLIDDSSTGTGTVRAVQTITTATSTDYVYSFEAKKDQLDWCLIQVSNMAAQSIHAYVDLTNKVFGTIGTDVTGRKLTVLADDWVLIEIGFTSDSSDTSADYRCVIAEANNDAIVDLDGTSSILFHEGQLETGLVATSRIPTTTTSVTRATQAGALTYSIDNWLDANCLVLCDFSIGIDQGDIAATLDVFGMDSGVSVNGVRFGSTGDLKAADGTNTVAISDWAEPADGIIRTAMGVNTSDDALDLHVKSNVKSLTKGTDAYDDSVANDIITVFRVLPAPATIYSIQAVPNNYLTTVNLDDDS